MLVGEATGQRHWVHPAWHDAAAPLAIDPDYAPAMLTVGSLEYSVWLCRAEAMAWFLKLTSVPAETEDLSEIIPQSWRLPIHQR